MIDICDLPSVGDRPNVEKIIVKVVNSYATMLSYSLQLIPSLFLSCP